MSSSPACSNYNLHLSNENDVIAATPTPLEQEQDPLSSIIDTELVTFANLCNDADFNDFLNNFMQQETEPESNVSCKLRHVSHSHHLCDGLWSAVVPPSTASKTDGNDNDDDDETTSTPTTPNTDTPDYTDTYTEGKTAVTLDRKSVV